MAATAGPGSGPLIVMTRIVKPVLSPAGDRVLGSRTLDTNASAFIVGDPRGRIWQLPGESLQAFEERLALTAADVARTQGFLPYERDLLASARLHSGLARYPQ